MRWNCPHCGVALAVSDDKLGTGWSFSRCYRCGGFALVRRSEINLIKVDRPPQGENVLLPEATENPMLSHQALQNLAGFQQARRSGQAIRPSIIPAKTTRSTESTFSTTLSAAPDRSGSADRVPSNPPPFPVQRAIETLHYSQTQRPPAPPIVHTSAPSSPQGALLLPDPLPEEPRRPWYYRLLPVVIAGTSLITIGSGVYVFLKANELKNLQNKKLDFITARAMAPKRSVAESERPTISENEAAIVLRPGTDQSPLYEEPAANSKKVGTAESDLPYIINDLRPGWYQIYIRENGHNKTAWIPSSQVELFTGESPPSAD